MSNSGSNWSKPCWTSHLCFIPIENDESESEVIGSPSDPIDRSDDPQPFLPISEHVPYAGATVTMPDGATQFYAMMNNRRSVRAFSTRPVDYAIIEKCVLAAGTSPSGAHTEPWTFCVIESASIKSAIRDIIEKEEYENYMHRMSRQWTADLTPLKTNHEKSYLTDAPYLILVFKQVYGTYVECDISMTSMYVNLLSFLYWQDFGTMGPKSSTIIMKFLCQSLRVCYYVLCKRPD